MSVIDSLRAMIQLGDVAAMPSPDWLKLVAAQAQPVTFICPECDKRFMLKLHTLDAFSPEIKCTCGYLFMGPS